MEPNRTEIAKKLYNMIRIAMFMIQKGVSKSKFMVDLQIMMKRGKILGKALNDLMIDQHHHFSCISHDVHMSFISPQEYEFSCSNSPPFINRFHPNNRSRTNYHHRKHKHRHIQTPPPYIWGDLASEKSGVTKSVTATSPLVGLGFGWSPLVKQVRVTDSPFTMSRDGDGDENCLVDMEAEKFIESFYGELRLQKSMGTRWTPNNYG